MRLAKVRGAPECKDCEIGREREVSVVSAKVGWKQRSPRWTWWTPLHDSGSRGEEQMGIAFLALVILCVFVFLFYALFRSENF